MSDLVEGRNAVLEALKAGVSFNKFLVARGLERAGVLDEIVRRAGEAGVSVEEAPRSKLDEISGGGVHQGVIGFTEPFSYTPLERILKDAEDSPHELLVALDHVTDPHNLGAIARSAEVVGARGVLIPSRRSASVGPAAMKASAGALAHLPVSREPNLVRMLESCKAAGFWVAGAAGDAPLLAWEAPLEGRLVLVLGAEDSGLSRLARDHCDFLVRLPVRGHVESLNVAQAATVLMFEWLRRSESGV